MRLFATVVKYKLAGHPEIQAGMPPLLNRLRPEQAHPLMHRLQIRRCQVRISPRHLKQCRPPGTLLIPEQGLSALWWRSIYFVSQLEL
jgi:hypothetical protein